MRGLHHAMELFFFCSTASQEQDCSATAIILRLLQLAGISGPSEFLNDIPGVN